MSQWLSKKSLTAFLSLFYISNSPATEYDWLYWKTDKYYDFFKELELPPIQVMPVSFTYDKEKAKELLEKLKERGFFSLHAMLIKVFWAPDNQQLINVLEFLLKIENIELIITLENSTVAAQVIGAGKERKITPEDQEIQFLLWFIDNSDAAGASDLEDPVAVLWFIYQQEFALRNMLLATFRENAQAVEFLQHHEYLIDELQTMVTLGLPDINSLDDILHLIVPYLQTNILVDGRSLFLLLVGMLFRSHQLNKEIVENFGGLQTELISILQIEELPAIFNLPDIAGGLLLLLHSYPRALMYLSRSTMVMPIYDIRELVIRLNKAAATQSQGVRNILRLFMSFPELIQLTADAVAAKLDLDALLAVSGELDEYKDLIRAHNMSLLMEDMALDPEPTAYASEPVVLPAVTDPESQYQEWLTTIRAEVLTNHKRREAILAQIYSYHLLRGGLIDLGVCQVSWLESLLEHPEILQWLSHLLNVASKPLQEGFSASLVERAGASIHEHRGIINRVLFMLRLLNEVQRQGLAPFSIKHTCPLPEDSPLLTSMAGFLVQQYGVTSTEGDNLSSLYWNLLANNPLILQLGISNQPFSRCRVNMVTVANALALINEVLTYASINQSSLQFMIAFPGLTVHLLTNVTTSLQADSFLSFVSQINYDPRQMLSVEQMQLILWAGNDVIPGVTSLRSHIAPDMPALSNMMKEVLSPRLLGSLINILVSRFHLESPASISLEKLTKLIQKVMSPRK